MGKQNDTTSQGPKDPKKSRAKLLDFLKKRNLLDDVKLLESGLSDAQSREKLWKGLYDSGVYSKNIDEFNRQFYGDISVAPTTTSPTDRPLFPGEDPEVVAVADDLKPAPKYELLDKGVDIPGLEYPDTGGPSEPALSPYSPMEQAGFSPQDPKQAQTEENSLYKLNNTIDTADFTGRTVAETGVNYAGSNTQLSPEQAKRKERLIETYGTGEEVLNQLGQGAVKAWNGFLTSLAIGADAIGGTPEGFLERFLEQRNKIDKSVEEAIPTISNNLEKEGLGGFTSNDVKDLATGVKWLAGTAAASAPQLAAYAANPALGSAIAFTNFQSDIWLEGLDRKAKEELVAEGITPTQKAIDERANQIIARGDADLAASYIGALGATSLDYLGFKLSTSALTKAISQRGLTNVRRTVGDKLGRAATEFGKASVGEGATEAAQEAITYTAAQNVLLPDAAQRKELLPRAREAFIGGLAIGGLLGAGPTAVRVADAATTPKQNPELAQKEAEVQALQEEYVRTGNKPSDLDAKLAEVTRIRQQAEETAARQAEEATQAAPVEAVATEEVVEPAQETAVPQPNAAPIVESSQLANPDVAAPATQGSVSQVKQTIAQLKSLIEAQGSRLPDSKRQELGKTITDLENSLETSLDERPSNEIATQALGEITTNKDAPLQAKRDVLNTAILKINERAEPQAAEFIQPLVQEQARINQIVEQAALAKNPGVFERIESLERAKKEADVIARDATPQEKEVYKQYTDTVKKRLKAAKKELDTLKEELLQLPEVTLLSITPESEIKRRAAEVGIPLGPQETLPATPSAEAPTDIAPPTDTTPTPEAEATTTPTQTPQETVTQEAPTLEPTIEKRVEELALSPETEENTEVGSESDGVQETNPVKLKKGTTEAEANLADEIDLSTTDPIEFGVDPATNQRIRIRPEDPNAGLTDEQVEAERQKVAEELSKKGNWSEAATSQLDQLLELAQKQRKQILQDTKSKDATTPDTNLDESNPIVVQGFGLNTFFNLIRSTFVVFPVLRFTFVTAPREIVRKGIRTGAVGASRAASAVEGSAPFKAVLGVTQPLYDLVDGSSQRFYRRFRDVFASYLKGSIERKGKLNETIRTVLRQSLSSLSTTVTKSLEEAKAGRRLTGTKQKASLEAHNFYVAASGIVNYDRVAMARVHAILDPALYQKTTDIGGRPVPKQLQDLNPEEIAVYNLVRQTLDYVHDSYFALGLLDYATYVKYKGNYTPRLYEEFEQLGDDSMASIENYLAKIGMNLSAAKNKVQYGIFKRRKPIDEVSQLQKIQDPAYLAAFRIGQLERNRAVLNYANSIIAAGTPTYTDGDLAAKGLESIPGYKKLKSPVYMKQYGPLSNMWVPWQVAEELQGFQFSDALVRSVYNFTTAYGKLEARKYIRQYHTVLSPKTNLGNWISQSFFAGLSGINMVSFIAQYEAALNSVRTKDDTYKKLLAEGILGTSLSTVDEVAKGFNSKALRQHIDQKLNELGVGIDANGKTISEWKRARAAFDASIANTKLIAGEVTTQMQEWYSQADDVGKIAAYLALTNPDTYNLSHDEAIERVESGFQQYSRTAPFWGFSSNVPLFGNAFIRFKAELARNIKNAFLQRPLTLLTYGTMLQLVSGLSLLLSDESKEEYDLRTTRQFIPKFDVPFSDKLDIPLVVRVGNVEYNISRYTSAYFVYDRGSEDLWMDKVTSFMPINLDFQPGAGSSSWPKPGPNTLGGLILQDPLIAPVIQLARDEDFRGKPIIEREATKFREGIATDEEAWLRAGEFLSRAYLPILPMAFDFYNSATYGKDYYGRSQSVATAMLNQTLIKAQKFGDQDYIEVINKERGWIEAEYQRLRRRASTIKKVYLEEKAAAAERLQRGEITEEQYINIEKRADKEYNARSLSLWEDALAFDKKFQERLRVHDVIFEQNKAKK